MEYKTVKEALKIAKISRAKFYKVFKLYPSIKEGKRVNIEELYKCINTYEKQKNTNDISDTVTQEFTLDEYARLEDIIRQEQYLKDLIENQKHEIAYLRGSLDSKDKQMNTIIQMSQDLTLSVKQLTNSIEQRNYIEAKEKKLE